jgi:serine/threonine protein kinase
MTAAKAGLTDLVADVDKGLRLGGGGFGEVYETQLSPHGLVAVKVIDRTGAEVKLGIKKWADLKKHLFAEAESLKKAAHDHVVRVFAVARSRNRKEVYIFSERCDESLQRKTKSRPMRLSDAHRATGEMLLGLEALHGRGMIHRDIKPGNVLLKNGITKLADFGLVTDTMIAGYASFAGSLDHLAPEVFDVTVTSTKTDVWAMGITLFRLLNGGPWYDELQEAMGIDWHADARAAADKIEDLVTSGRYVPRLRWMPHIPKPWRRFVAKALHMQSAKRYRDGGVMATAFAHACLPDGPDWDCEFNGDSIIWKRMTSDRRFSVVWQRHSAKRQEFLAQSEPASGTGRIQILRRNKGLVSVSEAYRELEIFFGTRSK